MASNNEPSQQFRPRALCVAVSAACAGVAPSALAQDNDDDLRIENIIVTATKREASLQNIPMSITAITDEDIVRQGFKQLDDYIGHIPALSFGRREPGGTNVIMRGCAVSGIAFAGTATTAVYLDEQPITVAGFNPDPRLVDIQRVEALSGPQGTLFGDASQCGTLRIITNKPDSTAFDGWIDLTGTSIEHGDTGYDVSAMVNIPFANNKAALRLVGFYAEEAGYIDNVLGTSPFGTFDNSEFVKADINRTTVSGARAGLRFSPGDNWTVDLTGIFQHKEADGFGDTDLDENFLEGSGLGEWEQLRFGDDFFEDEWYQAALTIEGSLGWADLTIAASFLNRQTHYAADSTAYHAYFQSFANYVNTDPASPYFIVCQYYLAQGVPGGCPSYDLGGDPQAMSFDTDDQDFISLEVRLATPADSDSRWSGIVGFFYNKTDDHTHFSANVRDLRSTNGWYYNHYIKFTGCDGGLAMLDPALYVAKYYCPSGLYIYYAGDVANYLAPTVKLWDGVYNTELEQVAIFGEVSVDITERFNLTVGGRWFDIQNDRTVENGTLIATSTPYTVQGPEIVCDLLPTAPPETQQLCYTGERDPATADETGFVPKVTATFNTADDKMIYFTYSEGFRRGGGNAARPASVFGQPPFNTFDSDLVKNFEIGTKTTWADGRFQFNLTAYHMIWEDIQIEANDPDPDIFTLGTINLAEAEIDGLEAFVNWIPAEGWSIAANIGYNDAKVSETSVIFPGLTPPQKGDRLPLVPDWKASIVLDYEFNSELWGTIPSLHLGYNYTGDSVSSLAGIQGVIAINPVRVQEAYSITNLRFGLDGGGWSAALFIDNVFDEYAKQYYNDRWAQTRLSVNRPRTIGINYRRRFK